MKRILFTFFVLICPIISLADEADNNTTITTPAAISTPTSVEISNSQTNNSLPDRLDPNKLPITIKANNGKISVEQTSAGDGVQDQTPQESELSFEVSSQTTEENRKAAEQEYRSARDNEQSNANKGLVTITTAATGLGAMEWASGRAEQNADADAETEMSAYIATMKCEYGGGRQVDLGVEETLPGGNEMLSYYTEFKQLAEKLKETKTALNLRPGIEAEVIYDHAETGLYNYQTTKTGGGANPSLSRALMNPDGADAAAWNAQKQESTDKVQGGKIATISGVAAGVAGNAIINKDKSENDSKNHNNTKNKSAKKGDDCSALLRSTTHVKSAKYDENGNCILICRKNYEKTADNLQCVPTEEKELKTANRENRKNMIAKEAIDVYGDTANVALTGVGAFLDPAAGTAMANATGQVATGKHGSSGDGIQQIRNSVQK